MCCQCLKYVFGHPLMFHVDFANCLMHCFLQKIKPDFRSNISTKYNILYEGTCHQHFIHTGMSIVHWTVMLQRIIDVNWCFWICCESSVQQLFTFTDFLLLFLFLLLEHLQGTLYTITLLDGILQQDWINIPANVEHHTLIDLHASWHSVFGLRALCKQIHLTGHSFYIIKHKITTN